MPALPGPPPRASTPSVRGGAGNAPRKDKYKRREGDGDFGDFHVRGGSSVPQQSRGNAPHGKSRTSRPRSIAVLVWGEPQSEQSPVRWVNLPAKIDKAAGRNSKTTLRKHA